MAAPLGRGGFKHAIYNCMYMMSRADHRGSYTVRNVFVYDRNRSARPKEVKKPPTEPFKVTKEKIEIPMVKKRDPLAVLKALASTAGTDYDAPHYKYIDDPYLIPRSASEKRRYTLAKASGRKAAKYVVAQYPRNFQFSRADPPIPEFIDRIGFSKPENEESGLLERIEDRSVMSAYECYQKIKEAGSPLSHETLTDLLALLCAYNSEDVPESLEPEERVFKHDVAPDQTQKIKKTWKDHGAAEQLFAEMTDKTPADYNLLVRGRAKYLQMDKARDLLQEMKDKKIAVDEATYNILLEKAAFTLEKSELVWVLLKEYLQEMADNKISPTLATFNGVLHSLSRMTKYGKTRSWTMEVLNEMKSLKIEPSLTSWYYVLRVFYAKNDSNSSMLFDILRHIGRQEFTAQEKNDLEFFPTAMVACFQMKDLETALKLDDLLNTGKNIHLLGDNFKQGVYYTYFLRLLCMFEQIDTIMKYYEKFTPHMYTPSFTALNDLLQAIELNEGYQYLPKLWSDLVVYDYTRRKDLVMALLTSMARKKQPEELQKKFAEITSDLKHRMAEDLASKNIIQHLRLTGSMVGDLVLINMNAGLFEQAWEFFELYLANKYEMEDFPSENSLIELANTCLEQKDVEKVLKCLEVMSDCAYPKLDAMLDKVEEEMELTNLQKNLLEDMR